MKKLWLVPVAAIALCACYLSSGSSSSQGSSSLTCAVNVPATCPSNSPSYATDVSPVLFNYCTSCHQPNGSQSGKPLDTYQDVASLASKVQSKIADCSMPPSGNPGPTAAERDAIVAWIVCGARNN